jgi:hypothetical protein
MLGASLYVRRRTGTVVGVGWPEDLDLYMIAGAVWNYEHDHQIGRQLMRLAKNQPQSSAYGELGFVGF